MAERSKENKMQTIAAQIEAEIEQALSLLEGMTETIASYSPKPNHWSKKQLLGHLIDSAANNHQRFVRTAQVSGLSFPDYDQEFWVQIQDYQQADWLALVELWRSYNKHLAFFIRRLPEEVLAHECTIGANPPVTLEWLITDYLQHLKHHLYDLLKPLRKAELLERMEQGRTVLEQAISRLSEAQLTTSHPDTGWTIKDHLAHLGAWEVGIAALLRRQPRWAAMGLDEVTVEAHEMDDLNAILYQRHKDRPLSEVLAYFHETHRQMRAALAQLTDEDLFKTYSYYQPDEPGEDSGRPILDWVMGNTYEHYAEHLEWIEGLLD
jgi:hypothetical protein